MLFQPWKNIRDVEDCPVGGADWMGKWLERDSTEVKWKPFEGTVWCASFCNARASTGGVSILGSPLAMSDLDLDLASAMV